jgi:hypothetical protein
MMRTAAAMEAMGMALMDAQVRSGQASCDKDSVKVAIERLG